MLQIIYKIRYKKISRIFGLMAAMLFLQLTLGKHLIAQSSLKYKDVYDAIGTKSSEETFMILKEFQFYNPDHPNVYYQLGRITEMFSKRFDPMLYPNLVNYFTRETKNYYGLAKFYLEQKGKVSNKDAVYYQDVQVVDGSKKPGYEDIIMDIDKRILANDEYQNNVLIITHYFKKSAYFYDNCIQNFRQILNNQSKVKDLYLFTDKKLLDKLEQLRMDFDSTKYFLTHYQNALINYPIKNYKPEYVLKNIETYRLEGLTSVSFLYNSFYLWDFGKWVNEYKEVINREIYPLRKKMIEADANLNKAVDEIINAKQRVDSIQFYAPQVSVLNEMSKYDFESPVVALFDYKSSKIDFLKAGKSYYLDPVISFKEYDLTDIGVQAKKVSDLKTILDKKLNVFSATVKTVGIEKYMDLIENQYKNKENFVAQTENNNKQDALFLNRFLNNYIQILLNIKSRYYLKNSYAQFEKDSIAMFQNAADSSAKFVSSTFLETPKFQFVGGKIKPENQPNDAGFVAYIKNNKAAWVRSIKSEGAHVNVSGILLNEQNIFVAAQSDKELIVTQLSGSGDQKEMFRVPCNGKITHFLYDDIAQVFTVLTQNKSANANNIALRRISLDGKDIWADSFSVSFDGEIVDLLFFGDKMFLIANSNGFFGAIDGKIQYQTGQKMQISVISVNIDGKALKVKEFQLPSDVFAIHARKLNSATFTIIGQYGKNFQARNTPVFIMLDEELSTLKIE